MPRILLEGRPGSGKTTLCRAVAEAIERRGLTVAGFVTEEIRAGRRRAGFSIETFSGERGVLAHVDRVGEPRVGRYGVDIATFEQLALPSLEQPADIVVIDEIGKMELLSETFRACLADIVEGDRPILATVHTFRHPFTDALKARPDVRVLMVDRSRRAEQVQEVEGLLI